MTAPCSRGVCATTAAAAATGGSHYVINEAEPGAGSRRDRQHTQLGLGLLGDCCQVTWNQRLDLNYADNRLLKGFDCAAK